MHHNISIEVLMFEHGPTKGSKEEIIYEFNNIHIEKFWCDWNMLVLSIQKMTCIQKSDKLLTSMLGFQRTTQKVVNYIYVFFSIVLPLVINKCTIT